MAAQGVAGREQLHVVCDVTSTAKLRGATTGGQWHNCWFTGTQPGKHQQPLPQPALTRLALCKPVAAADVHSLLLYNVLWRALRYASNGTQHTHCQTT
jgi:hypothetical protein